MMLADPAGSGGATTPSGDNRRYRGPRQLRSPLANPGTDPGAKGAVAGLSRDVRKGIALSRALGEPRGGEEGLAFGVNRRHEGVA
jgi:hypothetical protein